MRKLFGLLLAILILGLNGAVAKADNSTSLNSTYNAGPSVLAGMIVELKAKSDTTVTPADGKDYSKIIGIVVPLNDAPLVLTSPTSSSQQVLVATSGRYGMLVSNQNGPIKSGDYLTVSAVSGVGMKATTTQPQVIGQAAGNFDGKNSVLGQVPLSSSTGKGPTVAIGSIPVSIHQASNPLYQKNSATEVPGFLSRTANSIVNRQVTSVRIYLGILVVMATVVITGSMLYSGVRSGMIAVGRNPLSRRVIGRSLLQIIITGLIIFMSGIAVAYLILKL